MYLLSYMWDIKQRTRVSEWFGRPAGQLINLTRLSGEKLYKNRTQEDNLYVLYRKLSTLFSYLKFVSKIGYFNWFFKITYVVYQNQSGTLIVLKRVISSFQHSLARMKNTNEHIYKSYIIFSSDSNNEVRIYYWK